MTDSTSATPVLFPNPAEAPDTIRAAATETLLVGALMLSDVQRDSPNWPKGAEIKETEKRFRQVLERLAKALSYGGS